MPKRKKKKQFKVKKTKEVARMPDKFRKQTTGEWSVSEPNMGFVMPSFMKKKRR